MRSFRKTLRLLSLIGILFCTSCDKLSPRQADEAATKVSETEVQIAKEKAAVEKELSSLTERHSAQRNWLAFAEHNFKHGQGRITLTLEYQDALKRLNGQPVVVVGHIIDVYENGGDYRILCDCFHDRPPEYHVKFGVTAFEIEADAEAARYVVEMHNQHSSGQLSYLGEAYFAFVVYPTGLKITHNRRIEAERDYEEAFIVEGDLYPKCKILGRCLEVRFLDGLRQEHFQ